MPTLRTDDRPHGPAHYWAIMRALGRFTAADVHARSNGASRGAVIRYVRACARAGHCREDGEQTSRKGRPMPLYAMAGSAPIFAPLFHAGGGGGRRQQQMWTAARALRQFTARELAHAASTDDIAVSHDLACQYCARLAAAGYLWFEATRPRRYTLNGAMSTGPLAPAFRRNSNAGVDRNLRKPVNVTAAGARPGGER